MIRFSRLTMAVVCAMLLTGWLIAKTKAPAKPVPTPPTPQVSTPVTPINTVNDADILAKYDGGMITKADLEERISKLPPPNQAQFKSVQGQTMLLDNMAVEAIFYKKALEMNLQNAPTVLDRINAAKKQFYIQNYYQKLIKDKVELTEAEKQAYYNAHLKDYYITPNISIKYIQPENEAQATKALADLKKGVPFDTVEVRYSINTYGKSLNGVIKNVRLNGYIPGVGNDAELEKIISEAPVDTVHYIGPQKTTTGWSIIKVIDRIEGKQPTYLEVEAQVDQRLRPIKENELLQSMMAKLRDKWSVVVDSTLLAKVDLRNPANNTPLLSSFAVSAPDTTLSMTVRALLDRYNRISPQEQMMYLKGGGAAQLANQELTRNLMYKDALSRPEISKAVEDDPEYIQNKRYAILQEAYKRLVLDTLDVTDKEKQDYYNKNIASFTTQANRDILVIWQSDKKKAEKARKELLKAVNKHDSKLMAKVVAKYSIHPMADTLSNQYKNGIVQSVGPDKNFSDLIFDTPIGGVSPVFSTAKNEFAVFTVLKENPAVVESYNTAEGKILSRLKKEKEKTQFDKVKADLSTEYHLEKHPERLTMKLTAAELFEQADAAARQRKYQDAILCYDQIVQYFPNGVDDYKAAFMKAFLITEEMGDKKQGLQLFQDFLKKYPQGELNDSAQFMIDELSGKSPALEDNQPDNEK